MERKTSAFARIGITIVESMLRDSIVVIDRRGESVVLFLMVRTGGLCRQQTELLRRKLDIEHWREQAGFTSYRLLHNLVRSCVKNVRATQRQVRGLCSN